VKKIILYFLLGVALGVMLINCFIYLKSKPYIYDSVEKAPEAQAVIILGAAVYVDGRLSPVFENRVERALEVYRAGKVPKILVSGDNSSIYHNEVNPVKNYLVEKGVPEEDIYLDHAGFDTYSTMYRAKEIFKADTVVVVTQAFHLPRSIFLARSLGLTAYGVKAEDGRTVFMNYFREKFANVKAVINLVFNREPKFLGEEIPIS